MRIGIVNDRPIAVEALRRAVALRPEHQVIWVGRHGGEAVELCAKATPDLVLMDLVMPEMTASRPTANPGQPPCESHRDGSSVRIHGPFEAMGTGAWIRRHAGLGSAIRNGAARC